MAVGTIAMLYRRAGYSTVILPTTHVHVVVPRLVVVSCCVDCHALAREGGRQVAGGGMCVTDRKLPGMAKSGCP